jgi:hypothetical protein
MDGTHQDPSIGLKRELIYPTNIIDLFEKYSVPQRTKTVSGKVIDKVRGEIQNGAGGSSNGSSNGAGGSSNGSSGASDKGSDKGEGNADNSKGILGKLGDIFKGASSNVKVDTNANSPTSEAATKLSSEALSSLNAGDFEFMSIDTDFNDFYIAKRIMESGEFRPWVIEHEINSCFHPEIAVF